VTPRLSVVVPFFQVEAYISDCLRSLAQQTLDDIEVVLVDDGSPDGSAAVARDFVTRDRRFTLITQENRGLGPARNNGVAHSTGEFVTFVDSDDLVPRGAFELMVRTLDQTGSSFAAGDVRRFGSAGVRESLLHRGPFARRRRATHVLEFPDLAVDRLMCNKVYRRSFWDEHGYEFPAIRYEDYPIALRSHLDAVTVDCVAAPIYWWRFRESGDSITDHSHEYANLVDRVASAEMVLDVVEQRAPELRWRVHPHLVRVDLVSLLQAFRTTPVTDEQPILDLGRRLLARLDPDVLESVRRFDRLQVHALRRGDIGFLKELATFRHERGLGASVRARRRTFVPWQYEGEFPGLHARPRPAPRAIYRLRDDEFGLHSTVTDVRWHGTTVAVRGTAQIRHLATSRRSRLRVTVVGEGVDVPCEVRRFSALDLHGDRGLVGFEVRVSGPILASLAETTNMANLSIELDNGRFRRRHLLGGLRPGSPSSPAGRWVTDGLWVQPRSGRNGRLVLELLDRPAQLASTSVHDGSFVLSTVLPRDASSSRLSLHDRASDRVRHVALDQPKDGGGGHQGFTSRILVPDLVADVDRDDPLWQRTTWSLRVDDATLVATGLDRSVGLVHDSLLVQLTRLPDNSAAFQVSPVQVTADDVEVDAGGSGRRIVVRGPHWGRPPPTSFVWRSSSEGAGGAREVACALSSDDGRWSAAAGLDQLLTAPTRWTLYARSATSSTDAVHVDAFLASRLPIEDRRGTRSVTVVPEEGLLCVVAE
jgi:glycosyltransferase involved in cell wall biosynthesis